MDSAHLRKITKTEGRPKVEFKRSAAQGHPGMESQQVTFRETTQKEENYEKQGKNQPS